MIVFNLTCRAEHGFEGWFASNAEFEQQQRDALISCPVCGSADVVKALHAPHVSTALAERPQERPRPTKNDMEHYANLRKLEQLVEHVIANTEDVGDAFPEEARKIHYKEVNERQIRGNATRDEVKDLREEGIDVIPLPIPKYRTGKSH